MTSLAESAQLLDVAIRAARTVEAPLRAAFRSAMQIDYKRDLHDMVASAWQGWVHRHPEAAHG